MTKFDKLRELFIAWWDSTYSNRSYLYQNMMDYACQILPAANVGFWVAASDPHRLAFYFNRRDYLGRNVTVRVFANPEEIRIGTDPRSGKVNNRLKQHFEVLHDQV